MATQYSQVSADGAPRADLQSESMFALLRRLTDELTTLFRQEITLATAELTRILKTFATGAISVLTGGAVLFAGFLVLLSAVVLGLATVMRPWLAALIVGLVVGIVGYVMVHAGLKALDPDSLKPQHTPDSLRRDKDVLMRKTS